MSHIYHTSDGKVVPDVVLHLCDGAIAGWTYVMDLWTYRRIICGFHCCFYRRADELALDLVGYLIGCMQLHVQYIHLICCTVYMYV